MKKLYLILLLFAATSFASRGQVSTFSENFASVTTMLSSGGWTEMNLSNPLGLEIWHDGVGLAQATGAGVTSDSNYAEVSFQSTDASGTGDISNWLISPTVQLNNGDIISFFTTAYNNSTYPDRLELRINPSNTTNVGSAVTDTGDFTILVASVNPNLIADTAYYPQNYWGQIFGTVSGLTGATNCRIAFRYFVPNGGGTGINSSTIGVDSLNVTSIVGIPEVKTFHTQVYPNPASYALYMSWNMPLAENCTAEIYNSMGQKVQSFQLEKGLQRSKLDISALAKGMYTVSLIGSSGNSHSTFVKN